jgi:hypothetical protein
MIDRAERREPLFHPQDGICRGPAQPLPVIPQPDERRLESA